MTKTGLHRTDPEQDHGPTPRKPPESEPEEWPEGPKDDDQGIVDPVKI
jgi:hypothetical protein